MVRFFTVCTSPWESDMRHVRRLMHMAMPLSWKKYDTFEEYFRRSFFSARKCWIDLTHLEVCLVSLCRMRRKWILFLLSFTPTLLKIKSLQGCRKTTIFASSIFSKDCLHLLDLHKGYVKKFHANMLSSF